MTITLEQGPRHAFVQLLKNQAPALPRTSDVERRAAGKMFDKCSGHSDFDCQPLVTASPYG